MNKDEVFKLAIYGRATVNEMSSDGEWNICMKEDQLLSFANACEKIGMEKAAKICEDVSADPLADIENPTALDCAEAIRAAT